MENFNNIINQNRELFDNLEPTDGHFERFNVKLQKRNKMNKFFSPRFIWRIASIAIVIIISGWMAYQFITANSLRQKNQGLSLSDISQEYKEVETYLKSNVDDKLKQLDRLNCLKANNVDKSEIMNELNSIDSMYINLQKELITNSNDERIINAMINCYQMKVEVLDQIISQVSDNC